MPDAVDPGPDALIAELPEWNRGKGVSAYSWIGMMGRFDLAVGYSVVFWPQFTCFEGYVFREAAFDKRNLRQWERARPGDRRSIEAVINHIHMVDLHSNDETLTEAQARYLGRTLKAIWELKLRADLPDHRFEVVFNDEPGLDLTAYELTFWQAETAET